MKIEVELRQNRDKMKEEIMKFLNDEVELAFDKLKTELLKWDAYLKDVHLVSQR